MKTIWIDGSGWNGRRCGFAVCDSDGNSKVEWITEEFTNNYMEYEGLRYALKHFASEGDLILSDSQLVVNHVNTKWKVKQQSLFKSFIQCQEMIKALHCELRWIPREENKAGFLLEGK